MQPQLPAQSALKTQAKRLRAALAAQGQPMSHAQSLEVLARQHGFRNWNTLSAAASQHASQSTVSPSVNWVPGARISGHYLGNPFEGEVFGVDKLRGGRFRLTIRFDEPVDVVGFSSFSALRQRISVVVTADGLSPKRRSDGTPHLRIDHNED